MKKHGLRDRTNNALNMEQYKAKAIELANSSLSVLQYIHPMEYMHPVDVAEHMQQFSYDDQVALLRELPLKDSADVLAELNANLAGEILGGIDSIQAGKIISEMSPDDAADILNEITEEHRGEILSRLGKEDAEALRALLSFDSNTAGGIMNTEISTLDEDTSVDEAIKKIRNSIEYKELIYYAYIVDNEYKLKGVLSLKDLILLPEGTVLKDALKQQDVIAVSYDTTKQEVARIISKYGLMAVPVIDHNGHLLGIATYDDIIDIIQDEASSDLLGMVGAGQDETVDTPWVISLQKRLPWLIVNMVTSTVSALVVYYYEESIAHMAILAVLMPMVANQAGNTGQQALAVMIRQLATESFDPKRAWLAVFREGKIGILSGIIVGMIAFFAVLLLTNNTVLSLVMAGALMADMLIGAIAGGAIPLVFRAVGRDPAQASSIFLTAITDCFGFFIFLGLATVFLL